MTAHVRTYVLVYSQGFLNGNIGVAKAYLADVVEKKQCVPFRMYTGCSEGAQSDIHINTRLFGISWLIIRPFRLVHGLEW